MQNIVDVTLGRTHTCAVVRYGSADLVTYCWGANNLGQLGATGAGGPMPVVPTVGSPLSRVMSSSSADHTCGIDATKHVWCWGSDSFGQLDGTPDPNKTAPVRPASFLDNHYLLATQLAVGIGHTCAMDATAPAPPTIYCWGDNSHCQAAASSCGGVSVMPQPATALASVPAPVGGIFAGGNSTMIMDNNGTPAVPTDPPHQGLEFIGAGLGYCLSGGDLNYLSQCGNSGALYPLVDSTGFNAGASIGDGHVCVIASPDGVAPNGVWCWGDNSELQVDPASGMTPNLVNMQVYTTVADPPVWVRAGTGLTCAVFTAPDTTKYVSCQGKNDHLELARNTNGQANGPFTVTVDGTAAGKALRVTSVAIGGGHVCAISPGTKSSTLWCWGQNDQGQTGVAAGSDVLVPTRVRFPATPPM